MKNNSPKANDHNFLHLRQSMVEKQLAGRDITDERVLDAFLKVPRHRFVPEESLLSAYDDGALSIGSGQTISQPYMVALMTQKLELKGTEKVLEVGTGSGYQTAILAELAKTVFTIERILELSDAAQERLIAMGYTNIHFLVGDGTLGWPEESPFDRIIVTAGSPQIPQQLIEQLADGGILVIPIGGKDSQILTIVRKESGKITEEKACGCVFVKLIGKEGWHIEESEK